MQTEVSFSSPSVKLWLNLELDGPYFSSTNCPFCFLNTFFIATDMEISLIYVRRNNFYGQIISIYQLWFSSFWLVVLNNTNSRTFLNLNITQPQLYSRIGKTW